MSVNTEVGLAAGLRVVLVETSHPGNIGGAARAMKTMGLSALHLVNPSRFPSAEATARAAGADDVLYAAHEHTTLDNAISGCGLVVATTARARHLQWPELEPRDCAKKLVEHARQGPVAVVFGRERSGLNNEELERCHAMVTIPTNPAFSSLNVAAAVQIIAYELRLALAAAKDSDSEHLVKTTDPVTSDQMEGFYAHLRATLVELGYLDESAPKLLMRRLRRMFSRIELERAELNILRGILAAIQKRA